MLKIAEYFLRCRPNARLNYFQKYRLSIFWPYLSIFLKFQVTAQHACYLTVALVLIRRDSSFNEI